MLRVAWEPHLVFAQVHCDHCSRSRRELAILPLAFSVTIAFAFDLIKARP
jgi:hypothetical protein